MIRHVAGNLTSIRYEESTLFIRSMNNSVFLNMEVISLWDISFLFKFPCFFQLTTCREAMFLGSSESDSVITCWRCNCYDNFFLLSVASSTASPPPTVPPPQVSAVQWSLRVDGPTGSFTMCICLGLCLLLVHLGTACEMGAKKKGKVLQNVFLGQAHCLPFLSTCRQCYFLWTL